MDIQKKALVSAGGKLKDRFGPLSKAVVTAGGTKSSTALMQQKKAATLPKPQWHPPWKLMRVRIGVIIEVILTIVIVEILLQ